MGKTHRLETVFRAFCLQRLRGKPLSGSESVGNMAETLKNLGYFGHKMFRKLSLQANFVVLAQAGAQGDPLGCAPAR
jgi:hypothetical protein